MEKFKKILKKIFFLPPLPTVLIAVPSFALVIIVLSNNINNALAYIAYGASAYALVITCTAFLRIGGYMRAFREKLGGTALAKKLLGIPTVDRFINDVRFRTEVSLYTGLFINMLYIAMKLFSGIYYRSFWFIAFAVYYILLALMRFLLLRRGKRKTGRTPLEEEIYRYRLCGIFLLIMNQALAAIVVFMVRQNEGFEYSGLLIYAMALYSFYYIITAVINLVKFRKHGSPVMSAAKAINLVAAMVSILSLTTAMLAQFGGDDDSNFRRIMTGATGGGVCIIVIAMAVFMIVKSSKALKKLHMNSFDA